MDMRVVTWNIWQYGAPWGDAEPRGVVPHYPADAPRLEPGALWERRRAALVRILAAERPDLILLQESGSNEDAAPGLPNQSRQIADLLGYGVVYARASVARLRPAEHGQAALTRPGWTVRDQATLELAHGGSVPQEATRNALRVDLSGPDGELRVINVHFSLDEAAREESVERLLAWAPAEPGPPTLLAGDLNATPELPSMARLRAAGWRDCWGERNTEPGHSFPLPAPFLRLDYVYLAPGAPFRVLDMRLLGLEPDESGFFPSDHAGLVVDLAPEEGRPPPSRERSQNRTGGGSE
jgi:endonuclease/exonuclease/phosphatase family metal-dependent hydrolase